jgi:hypothetical protein
MHRLVRGLGFIAPTSLLIAGLMAEKYWDGRLKQCLSEKECLHGAMTAPLYQQADNPGPATSLHDTEICSPASRFELSGSGQPVAARPTPC